MAEPSSTSGDVPVRELISCKSTYNEMKYVFPASQRFRARSNVYFHPEVCEDIKKHLSESDYEKLRRGCMGSILCQGVKLRTNFQLIHHMLLHEVITKKKKEMWFKVDGLITRFSLLEFHVVTGLPCIQSVDDPPKDMSIKKFFGVAKCSYADLLEFFKKEPKSSPKKIIMAKLLLVEYVLLFRRSKSVKELYLSLACDADKFEKYPWGRESYDLLIRSLMKVSLVDPSKLLERCVYEMYGYPLAFQVWILEALPSIVDKFECSFSYVEGDPFSLHWCSQVKHSYEQLVPIFAGKILPLFPTYGEFVRKPGMKFEDEAPDGNVDYICEPIFLQSEDDPIYDVRKVRVRHHLMRYEGEVPPCALQLENVKGKIKTRFATADDLNDFESPKKIKKRKIKDVKGRGKKKVTIRKRVRSSKLAIVDPIIVVKDKKSTSSGSGTKFILRREISVNAAADKQAGVMEAADILVTVKEVGSRKNTTKDVEDIDAGKQSGVMEAADILVTVKEAGSKKNTTKDVEDIDAGMEVEDNDAGMEVEDSDADIEGEDNDANIEGEDNDADKQVIEAGKGQDFADEIPEWAKVLFRRLDHMESCIEASSVSNDKIGSEFKVGLNMFNSLEKRISVLESFSVKPPSMDASADILAKINILENRVTLLESSSVKAPLVQSIPADPDSENAISDVLAAIKDQYPSDSLPSSLKSLVPKDSCANEV